MSGQMSSVISTSTEFFIERIDRLDVHPNHRQIFISRYPQTRLIEHVDISQIECHWLSSLEGKGSIPPSLEKINHFIESSIQSGYGTMFLEGIEWLLSLHGFDAVYSMIRVLSERVSTSNWNIFVSISESSLAPRELSRFYREAPLYEFSEVQQVVSADTIVQAKSSTIEVEHIEIDLNDDGTPKLMLLTRLPREGFTKQLLQRRILQWRRMGLDTSDVEATLYQDDMEETYNCYRIIEEKVRRATELERFINENVDDSHERTIAMFRIRQLTGLDELESKYYSN